MKDDDEAWRAIVENYGDRAELDDAEKTPEPPPPSEPAAPSEEAFGQPTSSWVDDAMEDPEDRFIPPDPPPVPMGSGPRRLAWFGVIVAPGLLLVVAVLQLGVIPLVTYGLVAWFVAGFGYLVATMPRGPRDPGDDGAVV